MLEELVLRKHKYSRLVERQKFSSRPAGEVVACHCQMIATGGDMMTMMRCCIIMGKGVIQQVGKDGSGRRFIVVVRHGRRRGSLQ